MSDDLRIAIIGAGALGRGLAALCQSWRLSVELIGRDGLALDAQGGSSTANLNLADIALVAVKAFDVRAAVAQHAPRIRAGVPLVVMCNGLIDFELPALTEAFPHVAWRRGVALFGARPGATDSPWQISLSLGQSPIVHWGPLVSNEFVSRDFVLRTPDSVGSTDKNDRQLPCEKALEHGSQGAFAFESDMRSWIRHKWLMNTVINSLCAVHRLSANGELMQYKDEVDLIIAEAYGLGESLWGAWPKPLDLMIQELWQLLAATAQNENSMARDIRLGRRTETDYLSGLVTGKVGFSRLTDLHKRVQITSARSRC